MPDSTSRASLNRRRTILPNQHCCARHPLCSCDAVLEVQSDGKDGRYMPQDSKKKDGQEGAPGRSPSGARRELEKGDPIWAPAPTPLGSPERPAPGPVPSER